VANSLARQLRKRLTAAEEKLWRELRILKRQGYHFQKQVPLEGYMADFACLSQRLLIEVDGAQHMEAEMLRKDARAMRICTGADLWCCGSATRM
jgi:very-short-patch-repair endonuclease